MALVADAVNHLFRSPHTSTNIHDQSHQSQAPVNRSVGNTPQAERLRGSSQSRGPMSAPHDRDTSSQTHTSTTPSREGQLKEQGSTASSTQQPPSPTLEGQASAPAPDASQNPSNPAVDEETATDSSGSPTGPSSNETDGSSTGSPRRIKVRDLAHIQELVGNESSQSPADRQSLRRSRNDDGPQYEISGMPIENIIEMVAGLLTKITTTNDVQHEHLHRGLPLPENNPGISPQTTSVLAFHGKNVPSITILSYLNRINKYCPTSYEVFLSLLVYFDRMTEKVNAGPIQNLRDANQQANINPAINERKRSYGGGSPMEGVKQTGPTQTETPPLSGNLEKARQPGAVPGTPHSRPHMPESPPIHSQSSLDAELNLAHFFVVDSFNIHRLVIAGVTCASKFFSDIFYTNSRYAKASRVYK